jgi:adenylate cyclase class 2
MQYEVEQKHQFEDVTALVAQLEQRGIVLEPAVVQSDQYFAHPSRDFALTDEALRIRTSGGESFVTYKGPKLDTTTKTRHELELTLQSDDGGQNSHNCLSPWASNPWRQFASSDGDFTSSWTAVTSRAHSI